MARRAGPAFSSGGNGFGGTMADAIFQIQTACPARSQFAMILRRESSGVKTIISRRDIAL